MQLCECCAMAAAYDETCHCPELNHPADVLGALDGMVIVDPDDYCDFGTEQCAGCLTDLAGARYVASL